MDAYPHTLAEFERRFATEAACAAYLAEVRWPEGFRCPECTSSRSWTTTRGLFVCSSCQRQVSVTAGTLFHRSRLPLRTWFRVMWWVTNQKQGVSALGLQRLLGLKRYETAWNCLHRLRRAMVRPGRDRLDGVVEVDETFVGGVAPGSHGRHLGNKALVVIGAQVEGKGIGRIRMRRIPAASAGVLLAFVKTAVELGSTVVTDGWEHYEVVGKMGYTHRPRVIKGSGKTASQLLPRVHLVASLLKRWLVGTHQGAVSRDQLDAYLDEFTFRFNRRRSRHRGLLFHRLVEQVAATDPVPNADLVAKRRPKG
ncbi:MAG: IS1595 family transposase [Gemmatimonadota bacterium]